MPTPHQSEDKIKHRRSSSRKKARNALRRPGHAPGVTPDRVSSAGWTPYANGKRRRATKRAGIATGKKPRFRADKPRRGPGGSVQPETALPDVLSSPAMPDDSYAETMKGIGDNAWGDLHATSAVLGGVAAALMPGGWIAKLVTAGAAAKGMKGDIQQALDYWNTPEAQKMRPKLYPSGESFPP